MLRLRKLLPLTALICVISLILTGCDTTFIDKIKKDFTETTTEVTEGEDAPETEVTNSISLGIVDLDTLNPLLTHSETVKECLEFVYEPLFDVDEKHQIIPALAESYTVSPDGRQIEIKLRDGVTWQDGTPLTSRDAAYTFKQIRAGLTTYTDRLLNVADYMGIDDDKIRVTLNYAIPDFVALLNFPIVKYGTDMSGKYDFVPVGTGPFAYASKPNIDKILFAAFDGYRGGRAKIDGLEVYLVPDITRYESMFEASEIDLVTGDAVDLREYTPRGSTKSYKFVTDRLTFLGFNTSKSELSGSQTRRGLSKLIDKDSVVESTIYSRGCAVDIPINPNSIYYYDTNTRFKKDEILALNCLGDDGWGANENGDYVRTKNGSSEKLDFELTCNGDDKEKTDVANKIAKDMTEFGVPVNVKALPYDQFIAKVTKGDYDMMIGEIELKPNGDLTDLISSSGNYLFYANSGFDTLVAQMGLTQDAEKLKTLYKQYGNGILDEMPFCPIYFSRGDVVAGAKIKNELLPSVTRHFRNINTWSVK